MSTNNVFIYPIPFELFLQNEPDLADELILIKEKLQSSSSFFKHNSAFTMQMVSWYGGPPVNPVPSSFVPIQNIYPNPLQQQVPVSFLEDPLIKKTNIPDEFLKKYPNAAREIALQYVNNPPEILFLRTSSSRSPKIISERTLYWMQIYGTAGNRLHYLQKCVSASIQLIDRFKQSQHFSQVSPFDRNYRALIPYILQNTMFYPLSLPLVHALSAYFHSRANKNIHRNIANDDDSQHSDDAMIEIGSHSSKSNNVHSPMSDITESVEEASEEDHSEPDNHGDRSFNDEEFPIIGDNINNSADDQPQHDQEMDEMDVFANQEQPLLVPVNEENDKSEDEQWKNIVNNTTIKPYNRPSPHRSIPNAKVSDLPNPMDPNQFGFNYVPNCDFIQYFNPPCPEELESHPNLAESMTILEELPSLIQTNLHINQLYDIYKRHCLDKPNEKDRSLVLIDGGRFEFYILDNKDNTIFDTFVMKPLLSTWSQSMANFQFIKTPNDFKIMLKRFISRCYNESTRIHAVSFILDFPSNNNMRQWSHIDGFENMFQGSVSCGNGSSVTMEFTTLNPKISKAAKLCTVWNFLPQNTKVFSAIIGNDNAVEMIRNFGTLLNHDASAPSNPITYQKSLARISPYYKPHHSSPFKAGTVFRMPGNTIHAGPESDQNCCRTIFFYGASPPGAPLYDPFTQWNQVTLTASLLECIWVDITPLDRAYILEYMR
jgi:hypothetical protein